MAQAGWTFASASLRSLGNALRSCGCDDVIDLYFVLDLFEEGPRKIEPDAAIFGEGELEWSNCGELTEDANGIDAGACKDLRMSFHCDDDGIGRFDRPHRSAHDT